MSDVPEIRIGTTEREQALNLLSEHFAAGRLTVSEFDERSLVVTNATTRGELEHVFADLPTTTANAPARSEKSGEGDHNWRRVVMSLTPLLALVLFFLVPVANSWLFFLIIPAAGALLYGTRDHRRRDR